MKKPLFDYIEKEFGTNVQTLNFRFPIETLEGLIKTFYKDYEKTSFLVHASNSVPEISLKKITKSYFLNVPLSDTNEHLYIGLSEFLSFLIIFDEPKNQFLKDESSRFFLTFEPKIVASVFDHFYENYCNDLSLKEKKLLLNLKSVQSEEIDSGHVNKFQEVLLVNALNENNKIKQFKIAEAISYTDEAVIITDLSGIVLEANKTFEKYFGQRYMKSSVKNLLPKDFIEEALSTVNLNSNCKSELNLKTINGKNQLLNVSCYSYRDELNRPNGFVFIFKDVTDLKKLDYINKQLISKLRERNVQLTDVNKRLTDAEKIRIDLLSVISHELKTPISTIIGFGELISQREYDSETIKNFANHIVGSANSLNKLICDYLEVATTTFGVSKDKLQTSPVNVKALIDECYKEESKNIKDSKIEFEISSIGYEPVIFSEVENVKKLFSNLLNNSIKFSPNAGKVSVKVLSDGEKVTISISDEGIGLTLEQAKQVFEPFYRADNSITRQFAGIGLGLSVCRKIVELYGGSIWCEPGVDKGTVFYVTLPVNPHKTEHRGQNTEIREQKIELSDLLINQESTK